MPGRDLFLRKIDKRGRLYLGEESVGSFVSVVAREPGVWEIRQVPAHEGWLHEPSVAAALERAVEWSLSHSPATLNPNQPGLVDAGRSKRKRP